MTTHDPTLLDALESLAFQAWKGRVWRHMFNDYAPERVNLGGARWNPHSVGAIYTALDRETAIAEGQHAIDIQPRRIYRRRVLYELQVDIVDVVDLTGPAALAAVGLTLLDVANDDPSACQRVGGAAAWLGRGGLLVPSARNDGHNMVILLGAGGDAEIERISDEVLFDDVRGPTP
jgi:RES domain-containing protein